MNWKEKLRALEKECEWDEAIAFMQKFIAASSETMDGICSRTFF